MPGLFKYILSTRPKYFKSYSSAEMHFLIFLLVQLYTCWNIKLLFCILKKSSFFEGKSVYFFIAFNDTRGDIEEITLQFSRHFSSFTGGNFMLKPLQNFMRNIMAHFTVHAMVWKIHVAHKITASWNLLNA